MKEYVMSIDSGTTGIRAMLFDHEGKIISQAYEEITQIFPKPGWCEQNPKDIWEKCIRVMKQTLKDAHLQGKDVEAIGDRPFR